LREHGVERGDRVAVILLATPETAAVFFGVWKLGGILLSLSVLYGDESIRHRLANPHFPLGYWNRPADGDEVFGGEWFHTKDAARQDQDGYIWYEGRADDVIIAAGYRIGPSEVESACLEHPTVHEAAVIASPDELRGHVVKAFIVLASDFGPSDELAEEIKTFVRDRLSAYAYPRRIEFVADLPRTLTGKSRRIVLRQLEPERARSVRG
jgi:acetyl-CoA synthetase